MSLAPEPTLNIPEHTAEVARAAFPRGNRYMQMRDELGTIYRNDQFADLYPNVGQPADAPWRLALVTILVGRDRTHSHTVFSHPPRWDRACDFHRTRLPRCRTLLVFIQ